MAFPVIDASTVALLGSLIQGLEDVELKAMFGQRAAFIRGNMFAGTFGGDLMLRLDPGEVEAEPFEPFPGRRSGNYVLMPTIVRDDPSLAIDWIKRAYAKASELPAKAKKNAKPSKKAATKKADTKKAAAVAKKAAKKKGVVAKAKPQKKTPQRRAAATPKRRSARG